MSTASDFQKVRRRAEQQGFRVSARRRGRLQFLAPDKRSIITCAPHSFGSPNHGLENFLAKLKRAGYREDNTMEPAIDTLRPSATAKLNGKTPSKRQHPPARDVVIEYLRAHPGVDIHTQTLKEHLAVKRPDLGVNTLHTVLHDLKEKGLVLQTRARWYRVTSNIVLPATSITPQESPNPPLPPVANRLPPPELPAESPTEPAALAPPVVAAPGIRTGDAYIDGHLEELDAAFNDVLTAFGRIEAIVKRSRETLTHFAALKRSLGMLGDPIAAPADR